MTAGPTLEGVSDTFTFTCPCQATVQVTGGVEQPHDCPLTEPERQAIRDAAAAELDADSDACDCLGQIRAIGGIDMPHDDCRIVDEDERQRLRAQAAERFQESLASDAGGQADEQAAQGVDPLQLASALCINAHNFLAGRDKPPVEKQVALAQAIATVELARATRMQYQLNLELAQLAVGDRNAAIARQAGPSGIVVPSIVPGR